MYLSAIIVTYYPDISELSTNIQSYFDEIDKIIIWENTPGLSLQGHEQLLIFKDKLMFLGSGENIGIAAALNQGVNWSIDHGYTHILTLDQDSSFQENGLLKYKSLVESHDGEDVGVFGINPLNGNIPLFEPSNEIRVVPDTITSGSIFPLYIFKECGPFMDELFIDAVDYEFCYRINKKYGYKTVVFSEILLNHKVGYVTKTKLGFKTDNYSAFRTYFIVRNQLWVWLKYPQQFPLDHKIVLIKTHIFYRIFKVLLAEDDKMHKIKAIVYGLVHGLSMRTGFYSI